MSRLDDIRKRHAEATAGPYQHGKVGPMLLEEMLAEYATSLRATADYFKGTTLLSVHGVYLKDSETRVCITGISPNSPGNAEFIAASWSDVRWMIEQIETLQTVLEQVLENEYGSPEEMGGYIAIAVKALERSKE